MPPVNPGQSADVLFVDKMLRVPSPDVFERQEFLLGETRDALLGSLAALGGLDIADKQHRREQLITLMAEHSADINTARVVGGLDHYLEERAWRYEGERIDERQEEILRDVLDAVAHRHTEGFVDAFTATGKSYAIAKLAEASYLAGLRVLVLGPKNHIANTLVGNSASIGQPAKGLKGFAKAINPDHIGKQFDGSRASKEDRVVVSTYQSLNKFGRDKSLGTFNVVLADELHKGLGPKTSEVISSFSPHAVKIGFTATTAYGKNKSVDQLLPYEMHQLGPKESIETGKVSPVQCLILKTDEMIPVLDPQFADFTDRERERLINLKSRNKMAAQLVKDFVSEGRQGVLRCVPGSDLAHAKLMATELSKMTVIDKVTGQERPIRAQAVGGSIEESAEHLAAYERGEIDVITFVHLLSEGWDSQATTFGINLCPTTSIVEIKQFLGRILRLKDNDLYAIFVDFVDNVAGKQQATALHALEMEEFELNKVYGPPGTPRGETITNYLKGLLDPELFAKLTALDGQTLVDILLSAQRAAGREPESEIQQWEKRLAKEGLGAETNLMGVESRTLAVMADAEDTFLNTYQREPTQAELFEAVYNDNRMAGIFSSKPELAKKQFQAALRARYIEIPGNDDYLPEDSLGGVNSRLEEQIIGQKRAEEFVDSLKTVTPRMKAMFAASIGFAPIDVVSFKQMGDMFNVTGPRVTQAVARTLEAIRQDEQLMLRRSAYGRPVDALSFDGTHTAKFRQKPLEVQVATLQLLSNEMLKAAIRSHGPALPEWITRYAPLKRGYDRDYGNSNNLFVLSEKVEPLVRGDYNPYLKYLPQLAFIAARKVQMTIEADNPIDYLIKHDLTPQQALFLRESLEQLAKSREVEDVIMHIASEKAEPEAQLDELRGNFFYDRNHTYDIDKLADRWGVNNAALRIEIDYPYAYSWLSGNELLTLTKQYRSRLESRGRW